MRQQLKSVAISLAERSLLVPWLANVGAFTILASSVLSNRYQDKPREFSESVGNIGNSRSPLNDLELNFFARVAIERRPSFIIELGSYTLVRTRTLSELFPDIKVYGLDVTRDYLEPRIVNGVNIGPNTPEMISQIAAQGSGLICTRGTLCYYSEEELRDFFVLAFNHKIDLAISEPNTIGEESIQRSIPRTRATFYHPYLKLLRETGYTLPDNEGRQIQCSISEFGENGTFICAIANKQ